MKFINILSLLIIVISAVLSSSRRSPAACKKGETQNEKSTATWCTNAKGAFNKSTNVCCTPKADHGAKKPKH